MSARDQISIGSQSILWVAGVGVGLLTLAFVMGVQVGKQSAALHRPADRNGNVDLQDLPEPLVDQLKLFQGQQSGPLVPARPVAAPGQHQAQAPASAPPVYEPWTLQLLATPDPAEAKRTAARAKAAGFATTTVREQGQFKVRLAATGDKASMDERAAKLRKAGFKPFAVQVE